MSISYDDLIEYLNYDCDTGVFTWIKSPTHSVYVGDIAGNLTHNGRGKSYVKIGLKGKVYYAQRLAWLFINKRWPEKEIDHIDGDGTNNKLSNLRGVSRSGNMRNRRNQSNNKSGILGVHLNKEINKWVVQISDNYKKITIGFFDTIADAAIARKNAEIKYGYHNGHGSNRPL